MRVGLIGLELAGKKSLFSLLTGIRKESYLDSKERMGIVDVPDERINYLANYYQSPKIVYSKIEFLLIPSLNKDGKEKNNALLEAKEVDLLAIVIRKFGDESIYHPLGKIDILRDYNLIKEELLFADLFWVENRLERIEKQIKTQKPDYLLKEKQLLLKLKQGLEQGIFLNRMNLNLEELKIIKSYCFLTLKPIFIIVNCDEDKIADTFNFPDGMKSINISIKIESEIQQLDENLKQEFLKTLGLTETSLGRVIKFAYDFGDLISFITAGEKESHSWTIKRGTTALKSAGVIHSDIEKGFIRAEVISYDDFKKIGSEAQARKLGLYRLEGKDYVVKDGDIIEFRFNI